MTSHTQMTLLLVLSLIFLAAVHGTVYNEASNTRVQRDASCHCQDKDCGCCANIKIKKIKLDSDACISVTWKPEDLTATANITFGDKTIYHDTFSAHNPPSLCFEIPGLAKHASLCLNFYDVTIESHILHACAKLEAKLFKIKVGDFKFDCFETKI